MKNVTIKNSCADACDLLPEWEACECCSNGFEGYDKTDGPYTYCLNGISMIATSLTDTKNCDDPYVGSQKVTPTWMLETSEQHTRRLAKEAADTAVAAIPDGQTLNSCAGVEHPSGTQVPTCAELDAVDGKADAAAAAAAAAQQSANTAQATAAAAQEAADAAAAAAAAAQPQLQNCDGTDLAAGTQVVTCANFGSVLEAALEDQCLTMQDLGTQCGALSTVTAIDCGNGKYKLGIVSTASSEYGVGGFDHHDTTDTPGALWPADPDADDVILYSSAENKLTAAGGVFADMDQADQDQMNNYRLFCATHNAACDETIDFFVGATVEATDANLTKSQFIYTVNGEARITAAGLQGFAAFNNKVESFDDTLSIPVDAGMNTICVYLVKPDAGKLLTQFSIRNSNGIQRPRWRISKAGV